MRRILHNPVVLLFVCLSASLAAQTPGIPPPNTQSPNTQPPNMPRRFFRQNMQPPEASVPTQMPTAKPETPAPEAPVILPSIPVATALPATPAQPAQIHFTSGQLTITASNSSLTEIFRQISAVTGVKVIGTIADTRVYGTYGPASPSEVFSALLDGITSNYVFSHVTGAAGELTLLPSNSEVTPPGAISFDQQHPAATQPAIPPQAVQPSPPDIPIPGMLTPQQVATALAKMHQRNAQLQATPHN